MPLYLHTQNGKIMKNKHIMLTWVCALLTLGALAQNEQAYNKATALPAAPDVPKVQGKEVTIVLKNSAEKSVAVFAGPKEEIRNPKITPVGGLSSNKLYIRENDVVCIMTAENTPKACAIAKPGITSIEINSSATTISGK